jgi:hypothetical protein
MRTQKLNSKPSSDITGILDSSLPEDISGMEEYKIPAWARGKCSSSNSGGGGLFIPETAIFQRRASFLLAFAVQCMAVHVF